MDEADFAQRQEEAFLEGAIRAARGILPAETVSASECAECGCEIDSRRQIAVPGCVLCRDCAEVVESLRARGLI